MPLKKEIPFFATRIYPKKSINWYKAFFPIKFLKRNNLTGEAYPNTIFHPIAPRRVKEHLPNVKLIILLRNPIDRAFSAWNMHVHEKLSNLSFEEALEKEKRDFIGVREKLLQDENFWRPGYIRYAHLEKGIYVEQLKEWFKFFPKNQILIIRSEDFKADPTKILAEVFDFLELPNQSIPSMEKRLVGIYKQKLNPEIRKKLIEYFKPYNKQLYQLLGRNFDWDK